MNKKITRGFQREYKLWEKKKRKQVTEKDGGESGGHLVLACVILDHVGNQSRVQLKREAYGHFSRRKL